jgi:hypothetical protein
MSRMLYLAVVDDSIRQVFAARRSRFLLRLLNPLIGILAAMEAVGPACQSMVGHNHLAVFKKAAA